MFGILIFNCILHIVFTTPVYYNYEYNDGFVTEIIEDSPSIDFDTDLEAPISVSSVNKRDLSLKNIILRFNRDVNPVSENVKRNDTVFSILPGLTFFTNSTLESVTPKIINSDDATSKRNTNSGDMGAIKTNNATGQPGKYNAEEQVKKQPNVIFNERIAEVKAIPVILTQGV